MLVSTETKVSKMLVAKLVATETIISCGYEKRRYANGYAWKTPFQTAYLVSVQTDSHTYQSVTAWPPRGGKKARTIAP